MQESFTSVISSVAQAVGTAVKDLKRGTYSRRLNQGHVVQTNITENKGIEKDK